jgi:carbonic anhydrase
VNGIDGLIEWNAEHAVEVADPGLVSQPRRQVAVVTCMDARISLPRMLGVLPGDVHVLRNAGGIVTDDVLRSLVVSQVALGTTEVMVIQHTKCGMEGLVDEELKRTVEFERGHAPEFGFGGFPDVRERVTQSVRALQANPLICGAVRGFVFDVHTGMVTEVDID